MMKLKHVLWFIAGAAISILSFFLAFGLLIYQYQYFLPFIAVIVYIGSFILLLVNKEKVIWIRILLFGIEPIILIITYLTGLGIYGGIFIFMLWAYVLTIVNFIILLFIIKPENYMLIKDLDNSEKLEETKKELLIVKSIVTIVIMAAGLIMIWDFSINQSDMHGLGGVMAIFALPIIMLVLLGGYIGIKKLLR